MENRGRLLEDIREIFADKLSVQIQSADTDLFESGILDSTALVDLLANLERRFGCTIDLAEVEIENLRFLGRIAELVVTLRQGAAGVTDLA